MCVWLCVLQEKTKKTCCCKWSSLNACKWTSIYCSWKWNVASFFFFFSPIEWFSGKMILLGKPARNFSRKAFFFFFKYVNLSARTSPPPPQSAMWCSFARDIVQDYIVALKRITMAQRWSPLLRLSRPLQVSTWCWPEPTMQWWRPLSLLRLVQRDKTRHEDSVLRKPSSCAVRVLDSKLLYTCVDFTSERIRQGLCTLNERTKGFCKWPCI